GIEPLAVVADAQVHLVFHTMKRYAYLRGAGVAHDILDLFLYDPEQGQFPFLSEELDLRPFVMCELDRIGSDVPDVVHQPGDMVDQAELVEMRADEAAGQLTDLFDGGLGQFRYFVPDAFRAE